jgi:hypothetical protein
MEEIIIIKRENAFGGIHPSVIFCLGLRLFWCGNGCVSSHLLIPYIYYMVHCCGMNSWLFSAQSTPSTELKVVSYSEEMSSIVYCAFIWSIRRRDCLVSSGESKIWHEALYAYR